MHTKHILVQVGVVFKWSLAGQVLLQSAGWRVCTRGFTYIYLTLEQKALRCIFKQQLNESRCDMVSGELQCKAVKAFWSFLHFSLLHVSTHTLYDAVEPQLPSEMGRSAHSWLLWYFYQSSSEKVCNYILYAPIYCPLSPVQFHAGSETASVLRLECDAVAARVHHQGARALTGGNESFDHPDERFVFLLCLEDDMF